jgi:hypothetical protein
VLASRRPTTGIIGLEAKSFIPQQHASDLLTDGGWFSCSWKLPEGRIERCRGSRYPLAAVDKLGEVCEVLLERFFRERNGYDGHSEHAEGPFSDVRA